MLNSTINKTLIKTINVPIFKTSLLVLALNVDKVLGVF